MAKIFIGVGHGGVDSGARGNGFKESELNLAIALSCRDVLVAHGVEVKMSREKDENDTLDEEIKECNSYSPTCALDIHCNAGGGDGVEIFHSKSDGRDDALAQNVLNAIIEIGQNSRGLKTKLITEGANKGKDWFGFIRQINAPAILVECAFVDTKDVQIIDTAEEQKTMGIAIAKGILKTLGIAYKETAKQSVLYKVQVGAYADKKNAEAMLDKLKKAGFSGIIVEVGSAQKETAKVEPKKSVDEVAREVINGKWGNGSERKKRLEEAGYNYAEVQAKVNQLLA